MSGLLVHGKAAAHRTWNMIVCDDEKEQCDLVATLLERETEENGLAAGIMKYQNPESIFKLGEAFLQNEVRAVFLDIELSEDSGIEVARRLLGWNDQLYLLFVSSHEEQVFEAIKTRPFRFLRKSRLEEDMKEAVRALAEELSAHSRILHFVSGQKYVDVEAGNLISLESAGHYLQISTRQDTLRIRGKINDFLWMLDSRQFVQIQKGIVINMAYIEKLSSDRVRLTGNREYNISRARLADTRTAFMRFMRKGESE